MVLIRAGKSDSEEGLSLAVIRPENLIYFPFIPPSLGPREEQYPESGHTILGG